MRVRILACAALAGLFLAAGSTALAAPARHGSVDAADARFRALYTKEWVWRETELAHADEGDAVPIQPYLPKVDAASQEHGRKSLA